MRMGGLEPCEQKDWRDVLKTMKMNGNIQLQVLRSGGFLQDETETQDTVCSPKSMGLTLTVTYYTGDFEPEETPNIKTQTNSQNY